MKGRPSACTWATTRAGSSWRWPSSRCSCSPRSCAARVPATASGSSRLRWSPAAGRLVRGNGGTRRANPRRASGCRTPGMEVTGDPAEREAPRSFARPPAELRFVFEAEPLAVLDKPAGLVVHPGPGHWDDTLVNVLVERGTALAQGAAEGRPGIVHRLDRDTSGLLLVAKTDLAHRRLTRMIERREVERVYA